VPLNPHEVGDAQHRWLAEKLRNLILLLALIDQGVSLSGSVPLRAGGAVRGNNMARPREFLRGGTNSSSPSPSTSESVANLTHQTARRRLS
jgi:hypothetical protein